MSAPICPYCGAQSRLVKGHEIYPSSAGLHSKNFYRCAPCDAYVGCHPGTTVPLGRLANAPLRQAKIAAHTAFDVKWRTGGMKRAQAYGWLAEQLGIDRKQCHIGMFDMETCHRVIWVCQGGAA